VPAARRLLAALSRRGSHRVLRGDLAFAGLPGVVYTPEAGRDLPAVAFGHDWLTGIDRYYRLLEHLASWGIVAAAPATQRGPAPSVLGLAFDLGTTLDIVAAVRLGPGKVGVHPAKLGLVGHGFGAAAAVFAAAGMPVKPKAAVAIFPTVTKPPAEHPAAALSVPGMVLGAPGDRKTLNSNAITLAAAWDAATLRVVSKAKYGGLAEGRRLTTAFGLTGADNKTHKAVRTLLTGYLLHELSGEDTYREFADPQVHLPMTDPADGDATPVRLEEKIVALLKNG
jgi:dienelactone hydrolase